MKKWDASSSSVPLSSNSLSSSRTNLIRRLTVFSPPLLALLLVALMLLAPPAVAAVSLSTGIQLKSGQTVSDTTFVASSPSAGMIGLSGSGINGATVRNVRFENQAYGMKLGSGSQSRNIQVDGVVATNSSQAIFLANVSDSVFRNLDLESYYVPNASSGSKNHVIYLERGNSNISFYNTTLRGGSGQALHLYDYETPSQPSHDILFDGLTIDSQVGPIVISEGYDRVTIKNLKATAGAAWPVIELYGATTDIVIDGFEAWGGTALLATKSDKASPIRVTLRNGIYHGSVLVSKSASINDLVMENVTLADGTTTTTQPSTTTTTQPPTTTTTKPSTTTTTQPSTTDSGLLKNGGFETDSNLDSRPDDWTSSKLFKMSSDVVRGGAHSGWLHSTNNAVYSGGQLASVSAGSMYSFSGWVNIPETTDSFTFKLAIKFRNARGTVLVNKTVKTYTGSTHSAWDLATFSGVAPAGATSAQISLSVTSLNGDIYIDAFRFAKG